MIPSTRISFNVNAQELGGYRDRIVRYCREANPTTMLIMEDISLAQQCYNAQYAAFPNREPVIIHRSYADIGSDHWVKEVSKEKFADQVQKVYRDHKNLWVYVTNEVHTDNNFSAKELYSRFAYFINTLCPLGYRLVVGNFSAGSLDNIEDSVPFIQALHNWKHMVFLSEHSYGSPHPALNTNRLRGDGVTGGQYISHSDMIRQIPTRYYRPENWATKEQMLEAWYGLGPANDWGETWQTTLWHSLRISWLYNYAGELGYNLPQFIATEGLMDNMPDLQEQIEYQGVVQKFYQHLARNYGTGGYTEIKGMQTYRGVYADWFPELSFDDSVYFALAYIDYVWPDQMYGLNLFTVNYNSRWNDFGHNYGRQPRIFDLLTSHARNPQFFKNYQKTFGVQFTHMPTPSDGTYQLATITDGANFRMSPSISGERFSEPLVIGDTVRIYDNDVTEEITATAEYKWQRVGKQINGGWVQGFAAIGYFDYELTVTPPVDDTPVDPPTDNYDATQDVRIDQLETAIAGLRLENDDLRAENAEMMDEVYALRQDLINTLKSFGNAVTEGLEISKD
jgi:hypothetical protein